MLLIFLEKLEKITCKLTSTTIDPNLEHEKGLEDIAVDNEIYPLQVWRLISV